MDLQFKVSEERQLLWITRLQAAIAANEEELNKQLPEFKDYEKEYLAMKEEYLRLKSRIDTLDDLIRADKQDLTTFAQAAKLKPKTKEKTTVKQWKPSNTKHIGWRGIIDVLKDSGRFMTLQRCFDGLVERGIVQPDGLSRKRFSAAASGPYKTWKTYRPEGKGYAYIGLPEWFDGDVPKAQFLKDFIGKEAVV
jgi:hypothetical protein